MTLQEILTAKGSSVLTITAQASLEDVVQTLVKNNCGSLVVCDASGGMLGIITERDILRACAAHRGKLDALKVAETMTTDVITGSPTDVVEDVMGLMTKNRIRHMPILCEGRLCGMISIGDIVKAQHDALHLENHYLKSYIHG